MAKSLAREAIVQLGLDGEDDLPYEDEKRVPLDKARMEAVRDEIIESGAKTCIDIGCGEGKLIKLLLEAPEITKITGADVVPGELKKAAERIGLERLPERQKENNENGCKE